MQSTGEGPSEERLQARIRQLEEALRETSGLVGNAHGSLVESVGFPQTPIRPDQARAALVSAQNLIRAALNPDPPDPGTSDSQDTFD